jgi:hypothetical protein
VPEVRRFSLAKPTLQTRFHVDFNWWSQNDNDWHVHLQGFLCPEHQQAFAEAQAGETVDWVDPETAEIQPVDGIQHVLISHCARQPGFLNPHTALVEAVFRVFLANGNTPINATELGERLNRPANVILQTISGHSVYRGLRPILEN